MPTQEQNIQAVLDRLQKFRNNELVYLIKDEYGRTRGLVHRAQVMTPNGVLKIGIGSVVHHDRDGYWTESSSEFGMNPYHTARDLRHWIEVSEGVANLEIIAVNDTPKG